MPSQITVLLVNWYSVSFFEHLLPNLIKKAEQPEHLRFLFVDNTNGEDPDALPFCDRNPSVEYVKNDTQGLKGSWGHAHGMKAGLEQTTTPYLLTIDPDVYVFRRQWDTVLLNALQEHDAIVAGAPYPAWKLGKYHDVASPVFALLDVEWLRTSGRDWQPFAIGRRRNASNWIGRQVVRMGILGSRARCIRFPLILKVGRLLEKFFGVVGPDTGYQIADAVRKGGKRALVFDEIYETNEAFTQDALPEVREVARQFELYAFEGEWFMTHMGKTKYFLYETAYSYDDQYWYDCVHRMEQT